MASCHDMKEGEIYHCPGCGLELKVIKECTDCGDSHDCCEGDDHVCDISCCGKALVKK